MEVTHIIKFYLLVIVIFLMNQFVWWELNNPQQDHRRKTITIWQSGFLCSIGYTKSGHWNDWWDCLRGWTHCLIAHPCSGNTKATRKYLGREAHLEAPAKGMRLLRKHHAKPLFCQEGPPQLWRWGERGHFLGGLWNSGMLNFISQTTPPIALHRE